MRAILAVFLILATFGGALAGEINGKVTVDAEPETRRPRRYYMGPYRSGGSHAEPRTSAVMDVVVYIEELRERPATWPDPPQAVMRQKDERFIPHVLPIHRGTGVSFPNEDDFYHNVFSVVAGDRFDLGRYAKGDRVSEAFDQVGVVVVRCEIHPRMKAYIRVLPTPAFTVPAEDGGFRFSGLPAGRYTLKAWHPTQGEQERVLQITEDGSSSVTLSF